MVSLTSCVGKKRQIVREIHTREVNMVVFQSQYVNIIVVNIVRGMPPTILVLLQVQTQNHPGYHHVAQHILPKYSFLLPLEYSILVVQRLMTPPLIPSMFHPVPFQNMQEAYHLREHPRQELGSIQPQFQRRFHNDQGSMCLVLHSD